jgi:hypothetical protein
MIYRKLYFVIDIRFDRLFGKYRSRYAESDSRNICAIESVYTVLFSTHALHEKFLWSIVRRASSVFREIINKYLVTYTYFVKLEIAIACEIRPSKLHLVIAHISNHDWSFFLNFNYNSADSRLDSSLVWIKYTWIFARTKDRWTHGTSLAHRISF